MKVPIQTKYIKFIFIGLASVVLIYSLFAFNFVSISFPKFPGFPSISFPGLVSVKGIEKFSSEQDFKDYLEKSQMLEMGYMGLGFEAARAGVPDAIPEAAKGAGGEGELERVSTTTVQVAGIDEPDIVKTDGKEIYFSSSYYYWRYYYDYIEPSLNSTKVIKAFPPADLALEDKIPQSGSLLLSKNILVIFSGYKIYGYDISNPKSPDKKWTIELDKNDYLVGARLYKEKIYLITADRINEVRPCPIEAVTVNGTPLTIKCAEIYHPIYPTPIDTTYIAMVVNPNSGKVEKNISFVGSSNQSVIYMSENSLLATYSLPGDLIKFFYNFLREECSDLIPAKIVEKIGKLQRYDISDTAKLTEFSIIMQQYLNSLEEDALKKLENEFTNRMVDYAKKHKRDLEKTGIVKIGLDDFKVLANGEVPGTLLNQFSLDEYQNYLRIATTVGGNWGVVGGQIESGNDVYILDKDLKIAGSVKDLGTTERIYSARFIGDKGYLVTFRVTDPFYVLDLSNPKKPELKGELKIPGYSSYLHPVTENKILGIGQDGSNVKISLFDVTLAENPQEIDNYKLDEYWSEVSQTHHAFLLDSKHKIFFLPAGQAGYIFSYKNDQLKLERAVSDIQAKRAIYINDYLYIIGDNKIIVLNELDWEKVNTLEFEEEPLPEPRPLE